MSNNAFYVYGVVRFGIDLDWGEIGLNNKEVFLISKGDFGAIVHECKEKPYTAEDPEKIKRMILTHNKILDKAAEEFEGVIPLSFNTIIKRGKNSARFNLKKWLNNDQKRLEKIWKKIKGKKEYGLRIYYEKDKLIREVSQNEGIKRLEMEQEGKSQGLSYLLQAKAKSKTNEILQNKINKLKQEFFEGIKRITKNLKSNVSRISLNEEKDLLISLSALVNEKQIEKIREILEEKESRGFSFQLAGPFAPYSFVENGK